MWSLQDDIPTPRPLATPHITRLDLIQQLISPPFGIHSDQQEPILKGLATPTEVQLFKEAQGKAKVMRYKLFHWFTVKSSHITSAVIVNNIKKQLL